MPDWFTGLIRIKAASEKRVPSGVNNRADPWANPCCSLLFSAFLELFSHWTKSLVRYTGIGQFDRILYQTPNPRTKIVVYRCP